MQGVNSLPGILAEIVSTKWAELEKLRLREKELEFAAALAPPPRDFQSVISTPDVVALIAECKRRSPGAGQIYPGLDPVTLTQVYEDAGAAALSVLTDEEYFGGSTKDLIAVKSATTIPILRKDFTLDPLHVLEARAAGADAVLLIVRILSDELLRCLFFEAEQLGMSVLVETHDRNELRRAVELGAKIIGINNRDLSTFRSDLRTTLELLDEVPDEVVVVSESGIRSAEDVRLLGDEGVDAILVGEALLRSPDSKVATAAMSSVARSKDARG